MANTEHLSLVRGGVDCLNEWMTNNPDVRLNLAQTDLAGVDFSGMNLIGADMRRSHVARCVFNNAQLDSVQFTGADLSHSHFFGSSLKFANFESAKLSFASFFACDIRDARLDSSNLSGTRIQLCHLQGSSFRGALCGGTVLSDIDLSGAVDLAEVVHYAPSTLGTECFPKSKNRIPVDFVRNCGFPETVQEFLVSTDIGRRCFISSAKEDDDFASKLYKDLRDNGIDCWWYREDMHASMMWPQITRAIASYDKVIMVISEHALASRSIEREFLAVVQIENDEHSRILVPIRIDQSIFSPDRAHPFKNLLKQYWIGDFSGWTSKDTYNTAFARLIKDLRVVPDA